MDRFKNWLPFIISSSLFILFGPFLWCFSHPLSHDYISTPHPESPFSPPESLHLTTNQIETYQDEGFLILRNVLPKKLLKQLESGADDLAANETVHCAMSKYSGPPIFHRYSFFCVWPDMVHDYFRDALLYSPLAHVASQLMNNQDVRILNTFAMGTKDKEATIPVRWHADYDVFSGGENCDNGLVMWMPIKDTSIYEANGMVFSKQSHILHDELIRNGTWGKIQSKISGLLDILTFYKSIGTSLPQSRPTLSTGDVVIFSKCMVHTTSGLNTLHKTRYAWQIRFFTEEKEDKTGLFRPYLAIGDQYIQKVGLKYPKIFPKTLLEEDSIRSKGHVTLERWEYLQLLLSFPEHLFITNFVRTLEDFGLFNPQHSLLVNLVKALEYINLI